MKPTPPVGVPAIPRTAAAGVNALGISLLSRLCERAATTPNASPFISPASIASALALALAGAPPASETAKQIRSAIAPRLPADDDAVSVLGALSSAALGGGSDASAGSTVVTSGNSVWARHPLSFSPAYLGRAASLRASTHALTTAAAINRWCEAATGGRIKDAVDDGVVGRAVAVLVNALYFKSTWAVPFKPTLSRAGAFYAEAPAEGEGGGADDLCGGGGAHPDPQRRAVLTESAHFMARPGDRAARILGVPGVCKALRLAYEGGEQAGYEAFVVLPVRGAPVAAALAAVEAALAAEEEEGGGAAHADAAASTPRFHRPMAGVDIRLPAFTVDAGTALGPLLREEGVRSAFGEGPGGADFSDMLCSPAGSAAGCALSEVLHRVWIQTDEAGTEAAAVTAAVMVRAMVARPEVFDADHPFLFGVRHVATGAWLFLGRVGQPKAWCGGSVERTSAAAGCGGGGGGGVE